MTTFDDAAVERAAQEIAKSLQYIAPKIPIAEIIVNARELAKRALEAAQVKPSWPTDESVRLAYGHNDDLDHSDLDTDRGYLRDAFLADPIIKAATAEVVGLRGDFGWDDMTDTQQDLANALRDAGLLEAVNV